MLSKLTAADGPAMALIGSRQKGEHNSESASTTDWGEGVKKFNATLVPKTEAIYSLSNSVFCLLKTKVNCVVQLCQKPNHL